jgi:hypothetical protein
MIRADEDTMKSLWTALALVALQLASPLAWQKTAKAGGADVGAGARPASARIRLLPKGRCGPEGS